ncbi:UNVERIFIED_CONTAM: hypothetical protein Sangu_0138700 [Sesamum angustifolium]|uniref:Uncharacterized protein n=1 Tax=Sesamum angustifolium TaxID=2727405 RepID=A0AAW2RL67_9LAMI
MEMEMKANKNIGKYERYEDDDGFYKELERRIDELIDIDNPEEVKPCKFASSTLLVGKNTMVLDGRSTTTGR